MKIAVLLNTNQLGGAERSLIEQMKFMNPAHEYHFFYPRLDGNDDVLVRFLSGKGITNIFPFEYPSFIYRISRRDMGKLTMVLIRAPLLLWFFFLWHRRFSSYDCHYINGNKAAVPILLLRTLSRHRPLIYWHFRDFPSPKFFKRAGPLLASLKGLVLVANSQAVREELGKFFPRTDIRTIYNLPGNLPSRTAPRKVRHIGIVSMMAPWKGPHDALWALAMYQEELRELGIEKVSFFGASIYQTEGEHNDYGNQLRRLSKNLQMEWVEFPGMLPPMEIFSQIDLLIHPSLSPEPFGRVIVEAFKSGVPVISTGLGGSGELVKNLVTGLTYRPHDPTSLFLSIKCISQDFELVERLTARAVQEVDAMENAISYEIRKLILS